MALYNKGGSILKQLVSENTSMLNSAVFMSTKVFVGGLSWGVDNSTLKDAFSGFGEVADARVVVDRDTGKSKGFGFVNFRDSESVDDALALDGQEINGRTIRVRIAESAPPPTRGGGGYQRNSSRGSGNF